MRLTQLALIRQINKNSLKRQLSLFPGALQKLNPSKRNSPLIVNLDLLKLVELTHRLNALESKTDKILILLEELSE